MRAASFDIGIYNTGVYIEDFDEEKLQEIKNIPRKSRCKSTGEPTKEYQIILDEIYKNGKNVYIGKINFSTSVKKKYIDKETLDDISNVIKNMEILSTCDFILIEKQLDINKKAKRIENHIHSILNFIFPDVETIIYNASNKTQVLGAPKKVKNSKGKLKKMSKPERKKWACKISKDILNIRGDTYLYEYLFLQNTKPDDECDCICQLQSAKYKIFIEKSLKIGLKKERECEKNDIINILKSLDYELLSHTSDNPIKIKCYNDHISWVNSCEIRCVECYKNNRMEICKYILGHDNFECYNYLDLTEYYTNGNTLMYNNNSDDIIKIPNHLPYSSLCIYLSKPVKIEGHPGYKYINFDLEAIKELALKHDCYCLSNDIYKKPLLFKCNKHNKLFTKTFNSIKMRCRKLCDCK